LIGRLVWIVFRDVNRTLGGGIASMELLRRSAAKEAWLDERGHAVLTAVSRLTPGTNVLAYCAGLGWIVSGWGGVMVSLLAASVPAAVCMVALAAMLVRVDHYPIVRLLIAAGVLAATGLVASSAWHLMRPYLNRRVWRRTAIISTAVAGLAFVGATPVRILLAAAVLGAAMGMPTTTAPNAVE
jgi:chromate transporter